MTEDKERSGTFIIRRLNSIMKDIKEAESEENSSIRQHLIKSIWGKFEDLVKLIQETFPNNEFIPESIESYANIVYHSTEHGAGQYIKSTLREIADALEIKLDEYKETTVPSTIVMVDQNQNVTQISSQTFDNLISNINQVKMTQEEKEEAVRLIKEFESEAKKAQSDNDKLRRIFDQVASISKDVGLMLFQYVLSQGLLDKIIPK